jgi:hypothetical protein
VEEAGRRSALAPGPSGTASAGAGVGTSEPGEPEDDLEAFMRSNEAQRIVSSTSVGGPRQYSLCSGDPTQARFPLASAPPVPSSPRHTTPLSVMTLVAPGLRSPPGSLAGRAGAAATHGGHRNARTRGSQGTGARGDPRNPSHRYPSTGVRRRRAWHCVRCLGLHGRPECWSLRWWERPNIRGVQC